MSVNVFEGTSFSVEKPLGSSKGTVVLVHGIGSCASSYAPLARELREGGYTTVQYDLIGRGYSRPPREGEDYGEAAHVAQLHELLAHLRAEGQIDAKVHLLGHSMGGGLVALYASQYPSEVITVTPVTPAGLLGSIPLKMLGWLSPVHSALKPLVIGKRQLINALRRDFHLEDAHVVDLREKLVSETLDIVSVNPHVYDAIWGSLLHFPLSDASAQLNKLANHDHLSVFVIWAQHDKMIPAKSNAPKWEKLFQVGGCSFRSTTIADCGHMVVVERFKEVSIAVLEFLDSHCEVETVVSAELISISEVQTDEEVQSSVEPGDESRPADSHCEVEPVVSAELVSISEVPTDEEVQSSVEPSDEVRPAEASSA